MKKVVKWLSGQVVGFFVFILLFTTFIGCSKKSGKILAQVGSEKITVEEFEKAVENAPYTLQEYLSTDIGRKQYLDAMLKEKTVLVAAKSQGIQSRPAVKKQLSEIDKRLKDNYEKLKNEIIMNELLKEKVVLGDSEVKDYYEKHKEEFEKLVGKKLDIEQLKDRISMLGTDLEGIEGNEITVEVFPDRPDMLSEQGFARAFSSFIGVKTGLRNYKSKSSNYEVAVESSVDKVRPFTACAVVKNLKFDNQKIKSIIQLQEKLHTSYGRNRKKIAIGIYPMEKIKFPITYKALPPEKIKFIPLEYNTILNGKQILTETNTGRDYAHLLENEKLYPIFIDSNNEILSMPPIINSHTTGKITEETKDVFIECSGFDLGVLKKCLNIVVTSLADMGGEIYEVTLKYKNKIKTPDLATEKIKLTPEKKENQKYNQLFEKMFEGYEPYNYSSNTREVYFINSKIRYLSCQK